MVSGIFLKGRKTRIMDTSTQLNKLGFDREFYSTVDINQQDGLEPARITSVNRDSYTISKGDENVYAELLGKILHTADSALDLPTVGDWVLATFYDDDTLAIIHEILPRKSLLKRKASGKKVDFQLIGANIDVAFIVQSLNENFNLRRLERYLVMIKESKITPIVLLSKSDLCTPEEIAIRLGETEGLLSTHLHVQQFSNENDSDIRSIKDLLSANHTYCLLGSSGVGKTTLLNSLIGSDQFHTQMVSDKKSKGRHTTTSRQLIQLDCAAMVIDTPGMRELGNFSIEDGLEETFDEISSLATQCKFADCTHTSEKGCAILQAIEDGDISKERYQNFMKMAKESAFHEMSFQEKRQKDKNFGKLIKSVMKNKKSRR